MSEKKDPGWVLTDTVPNVWTACADQGRCSAPVSAVAQAVLHTHRDEITTLRAEVETLTQMRLNAQYAMSKVLAENEKFRAGLATARGLLEECNYIEEPPCACLHGRCWDCRVREFLATNAAPIEQNQNASQQGAGESRPVSCGASEDGMGADAQFLESSAENGGMGRGVPQPTKAEVCACGHDRDQHYPDIGCRKCNPLRMLGVAGTCKAYRPHAADCPRYQSNKPCSICDDLQRSAKPAPPEPDWVCERCGVPPPLGCDPPEQADDPPAFDVEAARRYAISISIEWSGIVGTDAELVHDYAEVLIRACDEIERLRGGK